MNLNNENFIALFFRGLFSIQFDYISIYFTHGFCIENKIVRICDGKRLCSVCEKIERAIKSNNQKSLSLAA
jgi:hypothetical protein